MRFSATLLFALFTMISWAGTMDSLRTEERNGKLYVIHQVDPGETLYSINRRYKSEIKEIIRVNGIQGNSIRTGEIISVPIGTKKITPEKSDEGRIHVVKAGETLFGIARKYKVKVDQIKAWNKLRSESLNIDQRLSIGKQLEADEMLEETLPFPRARKHFVQTSETLDQIAAKRNVSLDSLRKWNNLRSNDLRIGQIIWYRNYDRSSEPMTIKEVYGKKIEQGVAKRIDDMEDTDKYLALHKTLPSGTLLEVRNLMNNKKVFVRVVGQLPSTGLNENVIVRLTPKSFKRLGILDARAQVEITYYED